MIKEINQKEVSVIKACILRSKDIAVCQAAKIKVKHAIYFLLRTKRRTADEDAMYSILFSLDQYIEDHKLTIARMLKPFFTKEKIPFEINNGREHYWFSTHDLRNGYVFLYQNPDIMWASHVLFLSDHIDDTIINYGKIEAGTIHPFDKVKHVLTSVKSVGGLDKILLKKTSKILENESK